MTDSNALPLFYRLPVVFDTAQHGGLRFPALAPSYAFAAQADAIPLQVGELAHAIRHYPIVFLPGQDGQPPVLTALVGLGNGKNQFVDPQGQWRANTYIPAYVRRYPFVPMHVDGKAEPMLAIDMQAPWILEGSDQPFVDAQGQATARLKQVLDFQQDYLRQAALTASICAALQKADVLQACTLGWKDEAGKPQQVNGLLGVDEIRLKGLPAQTVVALHQADALGLAYAQLMSLSNLQTMVAATPAPARAAAGDDEDIPGTWQNNSPSDKPVLN